MVTDEQIKQLALKIKVSSYKRAAHVKVPTVWARFEGKTPRADGTIPKFRVQDVTDEWIEPILECIPTFLAGFMGEEIFKGLKAEDADLFIRFNSTLWPEVMKDNVALICVTDDEEKPRLAGFQMNKIETRLRTKEDSYTNVDALKPISGCWDSMADIRQKADVFKRYNVKEYLDAVGLYVKQEFRNQGIGFQILKAKIPLAKALGIKVIANAFGSEIASHVAEKVGMELIIQWSLSCLINPLATTDVSQKLPETGQYFTFRGMTVEGV